MLGNFITKTIGLTAVGLAGYDVLATTKNQTSREAKYAQVQRLNDVYMRTDALESESEVANGLQNWARKWHMGDNWLYRLKDNVTCYCSNFAKNLGDNITTIALGAVALLCGKGKFSPIKIPVIGKVAAGLLGVKAGFYVLRDLFGIGAITNREKKNI